MNAGAVLDILAGPKDPPVHEILNLLAFDGDVLVGVDLQLTRVFRLDCPDASFYNDAEEAQCAIALGRLLDSLPPNCVAQLMVSVRWDGGKAIETFRAKARPDGEVAQFLLSERCDFLRKIPFRRVEHYLAITTIPTANQTRSLLPGTLALQLPHPRKALDELHCSRIRALETVCNNAVSTLRDAHVKAQALSANEIREYLYERLNPATARYSRAPKYHQGLTLRDNTAFNACDVGRYSVAIDGHHHRAVNLHFRPTSLDGRAIHHLYNELPGDYDFTVAIHSRNQESAEQNLKTTSTLAAALASLHLTRYHEAWLLHDDAQQMLAETKAQDMKLYNATIHVVLRHVDPLILTEHADAVLRAFRRLDDMVGIVDDHNHLPLFLASLPGHTHLQRRPHVVSTEVAARFLTASSSWVGCRNPQVLIPSQDSKLVGLDLFSPELPAHHFMILGQTGKGKSLLANTLLTGFLGADPRHHVVIVDDGGSYRRQCKNLRGQYFEPALDGTYGFNLFRPKEYAFDKDGRLDADFLSSVTLLVGIMTGKPEMSNNEKTIIERCVAGAYAKAADGEPLLGDLQRLLMDYPAGDEEDRGLARWLGKNLVLWTEDSYSRLFNRKSTFDASSRFVVFDLRQLKEERLKSAVLLIIQSTIYPKLSNVSLRKVIVFDECWKLLERKEGSDLIKNWCKTARKFNGAVGTITQAPEDVFKSAAGSAIAQASTVKWVVDLGGQFEGLDKLGFSPEAIAAIKTLGNNPQDNAYRNIFVQFGDRKLSLRSMASPKAYWLYTTKPDDADCEAALRAREPKWSDLQIIDALGTMRENNPLWGREEYLAAIAGGRN